MSDQFEHKPPKWADRFLRWYCNPKLLEQIQGDVHELYYWRLEEKGPSKAKKSFIWDVIRLFRWSNIKRTRNTQKFNNMGMIKNYFKIGVRNLWKQRMPSTINIIGLSLAIGCCLVAFKWIENIIIKDAWHSKSDDIYLITPSRIEDGDMTRFGYLPSQWSEEFTKDISGIVDKSRVSYLSPPVRSGENEWPDMVTYVDEGYFRMFDFKMIYGSAESINDLGSVILSESEAQFYFGDEFPLDKELTINGKVYSVSGVIQDAPNGTSLRHGILLNYQIKEQEVKEEFRSYIFLQTEDLSKDLMLSSLTQVMGRYNNENPKTAYASIKLESLNTMAHNNEEISGGLGSGIPIEPVILLSCIAGFMLTLATFNYINISTSMAMKRMKEIGVRKVIGSKRKQLIFQFLTENLILVSLAIGLGLLLASAYFLPGFNEISGSDLSMDIFTHLNLWIFLIILLIFVTVTSGAYPAFYISSFKPASILRGNHKTDGKRRLTGILLTFQMILAVVTIMAAIMFVYTNQSQLNAEWGYSYQDKWGIRYPLSVPKSAVDEALLALPQVESVVRTRDVVGSAYRDEYTYTQDGRRFETCYLYVGKEYLNALDIELVEGRNFNNEVSSEDSKAVLVNEEFMKFYGEDFQEDMLVNFDSTEYRVVGVTKNFYYRPFNSRMKPAIFIRNADSLNIAGLITVNETDEAKMQQLIDKVFEELTPNEEVISYAQSEVFDNYFQETKGMQNIMVFVAILAIILSAMGLYGLVSVSISSRIKDFGIKKILGASGYQIGKDVYKRFALIIGTAFIIGGTLSVFVIGALLDSFYAGNQEPIGPIPLFAGGLILSTIAFVTIYTQVFQVKRMNPAYTLRKE